MRPCFVNWILIFSVPFIVQCNNDDHEFEKRNGFYIVIDNEDYYYPFTGVWTLNNHYKDRNLDSQPQNDEIISSLIENVSLSNSGLPLVDFRLYIFEKVLSPGIYYIDDFNGIREAELFFSFYHEDCEYDFSQNGQEGWITQINIETIETGGLYSPITFYQESETDIEIFEEVEIERLLISFTITVMDECLFEDQYVTGKISFDGR